MDPLLSRLHACIVQTLDEVRPGWEDSPLTVAELYQDVAPYRRLRAELGIDLNAEYEFALLRLLAGEGGLARLEPAEAREELEAEAASPNPNVGIFRKYAACDVWIQPDRTRSAGRSGAAAGPVLADAHSAALAGEPAEPLQVYSAALVRPAAPARAGTGATQCNHCGRPLPEGRDARFCPHCGEDQRARLCPRCGESAERGWRYCVACGTEIAAGGREA